MYRNNFWLFFGPNFGPKKITSRDGCVLLSSGSKIGQTWGLGVENGLDQHPLNRSDTHAEDEGSHHIEAYEARQTNQWTQDPSPPRCFAARPTSSNQYHAAHPREFHVNLFLAINSSLPDHVLVALAIRDAIRANRFARIIRN